MNVKFLFSSVSSACFELENSAPYYAPEKFKVLLNGEEQYECDRNVFSLYGLKPDTEYELTVRGETFEAVCARAADFLKTEVEPFEAKYDRILIVGHGACNRALLCHILKRGIPDFWGGGYQGNCAVTTVSLENGRYRMIEDAKLYY